MLWSVLSWYLICNGFCTLIQSVLMQFNKLWTQSVARCSVKYLPSRSSHWLSMQFDKWLPDLNHISHGADLLTDDIRLIITDRGDNLFIIAFTIDVSYNNIVVRIMMMKLCCNLMNYFWHALYVKVDPACVRYVIIASSSRDMVLRWSQMVRYKIDVFSCQNY